MLDMLEDSVDFAQKTKSVELPYLKEFLDKYSAGGLSMTDINYIKRFYERNNKLTYGRNTAEPNKYVEAKNIDSAVREWQYKVA